MKTRFFREETLAREREREGEGEIRNVRGRARGVLLSHSKGLLPASYGITVCTRVYFGSYREPALPLQKIITCIRVGSTFPPSSPLLDRAIIAHFVGVRSNFSNLFFNPPIIRLIPNSFSSLFSAKIDKIEIRSKKIDPIKELTSVLRRKVARVDDYRDELELKFTFKREDNEVL